MPEDSSMNQCEGEVLVYRMSRKRLCKSLIWSIVFLCICIWMAVDPYQSDYPFWLMRAVGILGSVFFSVLILFSAKRLILRDPAVIVSRKGIFDNATGIGVGWIGWEEIQNIYVSSYSAGLNRFSYVGIMPKNRDIFMIRFSWIGRFIRSSPSGSAPIKIQDGLLEVEADSLYREIVAYKQGMEKHG